MRTTKTFLSALGAALLAFAFSACSDAANQTANNQTMNAANKSTTANLKANETAGKNAEPVSNASGPSTPDKNSPERKAIMDALREPVSKELKQEVIFVADSLKLQDGWAFLAGKVRNPQGGPVNWKITKYQEQVAGGDFEDNFFALLKNTDGKWSSVTYMMNCLDVCYEGWDKEYKAPKAIFR